MKFFQCNHDGIVIPVCKTFTNENTFNDVTEIIPNTVDAAKEKHMPVVTVTENNVIVNVGSVSHPMGEDHSITTVLLETQQGGQYKILPHDGQPIAHFVIAQGDKAVAAYAYCNLHGLWKVEIE